MYTAYFDESGTTGEAGEFISVAGFVATDATWAKFTDSWNAALRKHGAPFLHTTDLANFKREFKDWDNTRRNALVADLLEALHGSGRMVATGAVLWMDDYNRLNDQVKSEYRGPLFPLFQQVVFGASLEASYDAAGTQVRMVYSLQEEYEGDFKKLATALQARNPRMGPLEFANMRDTPALQAADLIAFELRRYYVNRRKRPDLKMRFSLQQILLYQRVLRSALIRYISPFQMWLHAQPPWLFKTITVAVSIPVMAAAWFKPHVYTWAMGAPPLPKHIENIIQTLEADDEDLWLMP